MLTRTAKINSCRSSVGVYLKCVRTKRYYGCIPCKKKNNWRCEKLGDVGLQLLQMLRSTEELHHRESNLVDSSCSPPQEAVKDPRRTSTESKAHCCGEPSSKSLNVNHLKTGKTKGNTELLLDNIKWHVGTGDENNLGLTGFEPVECGLHRHHDKNAPMKNG